jgi:hypothetical protein
MKYIALLMYILLLILCSALFIGVVKVAGLEPMLSFRPDYWAATYVFMIILVLQVLFYQALTSKFCFMYFIEVILAGLLLYFCQIFHLKPVMSLVFGVGHVLFVIGMFVLNITERTGSE